MAVPSPRRLNRMHHHPVSLSLCLSVSLFFCLSVPLSLFTPEL
jgi:hypothetical protein